MELYSTWMVAAFFIGYALITLEDFVRINKATTALMMGVLCWVLQFVSSHETHHESNMAHLGEHLSNVSQVILFLLGVMIIVEIISAHKGFRFVTNIVKVESKRALLWIVGILTFFLSSVLDNLTTTIVMVSILQKIVKNPQDRLLYGGGIVIAANAGGAWTPIGDITTTMLWIGGQITATGVIFKLIIPSLACFITSFAVLSFMLKDTLPKEAETVEEEYEPFGLFVLLLGIAVLVFVPIFKIATGLPPFLGVIFGLSLMWLFTDLAHREGKQRDHLKVTHILPKVDISGPLFFLGILLAINALETAGLLSKLSVWIDANVSHPHITATIIGLASSVVDNIPLVAASMGMYDLTQHPIDASFWQLMAYCAGTGGSILVIGSAAGVAFMSMDKIDFFSYLRKISLPAAVGYFSGILVYLLF